MTRHDRDGAKRPLPQTPSQTVGPFFHVALVDPADAAVAGPQAEGEPIELAGVVLDGEGAPVGDALLELWQADAEGRYGHPNDPRHADADPHVRGFGRAATDEGGAYRFRTILPGPVPGPDGRPLARHANLRVFARGMLIHVVTRVFFEDDATDPVLAAVDEARRDTLLARREEGEPTRYRFDVHLQGDRETVFFEP